MGKWIFKRANKPRLMDWGRI